MPGPVADAGEQPGTDVLRRTDCIQKSGDKAHVPHFQNRFPTGEGQALQGQRDGLGGDGIVYRADALQAHLPDFPEGMTFLAGAVDVL